MSAEQEKQGSPSHVRRQSLPIGYWLKEADRLLTAQIASAQQANGATRFEWQTLNLVQIRPGIVSREIDEVMHTFVDPAQLEAIISRLTECEWIEGNESIGYRLTPDGEKQHAVVLATQKEFRKQVMEGISEEEYETAVRVLQRIVSNLSAAIQP